MNPCLLLVSSNPTRFINWIDVHGCNEARLRFIAVWERGEQYQALPLDNRSFIEHGACLPHNTLNGHLMLTFLSRTLIMSIRDLIVIDILLTCAETRHMLIRYVRRRRRSSISGL